MKTTYDTLLNKDNIKWLNHSMWSHQSRNLAYSQWIDSVDLQNKIVLDAGAGWGLLGQYALQKGAKHVVQVEHLCDRVKMLNRWVSKNGAEDRITVIHANLLNDWEWPLHLPDPDVILHEFVGRRFLNEGLHKILPPLKTRFPSSHFVPELAQFKIHYCRPKDNKSLVNDLAKLYTTSKESVTFDPGINLSDLYISFIQSEIDAALDKNIFWCDKAEYVSFENSASYTDEKEIFSIYDIEHPISITTKPLSNFYGFCMLSYCFGMNKSMCSSGKLGISDGLVSYISKGTKELTFEYIHRNTHWADTWDVSCR